MTEVYQVVPIEGRGLGIVATKFIRRGSLILKEVPQMLNIDQPPPNLQMDSNAWIEYIKKVISLFEQLTECEKEEYFKLYNKYDCEIAIENNFRLKLKSQMLKVLIMMKEADVEKAENILELLEFMKQMDL